MTIIKQFRCEADDTSFDVSGIGEDFFTQNYSGVNPPRLWLQESGAGDAKRWTIAPLTGIAFRMYLQWKVTPDPSRIIRIRPGSEFSINFETLNRIALRQTSVLGTISPTLAIGEEYCVELILRTVPNNFYSFRIISLKSLLTIHEFSAINGFLPGTIGPWTIVQTRFNSFSQLFLDNLQINDDTSKFIGLEPINNKPNGDPARDYELLFPHSSWF